LGNAYAAQTALRRNNKKAFGMNTGERTHAVFQLTGKRLRPLPISPDRVKKALA
jgi:hypothetical protein